MSDIYSPPTFQKSIIDVSLCITQYKIFDKKTSVEDRTQLTTTAKSCIADGQLKTLLSTIHQTPIIFYLSCLFFEWEIHEDGNGATTKREIKTCQKFIFRQNRCTLSMMNSLCSGCSFVQRKALCTCIFLLQIS